MPHSHRSRRSLCVTLSFAAGVLVGGAGVYGLWSADPLGAPSAERADPVAGDLRTVAGLGGASEGATGGDWVERGLEPGTTEPAGREPRLEPSTAQVAERHADHDDEDPVERPELAGQEGPAARTDSAVEPAMLARQAIEWSVSIRAGRAYGAGVLVSKDGLVLTALHVIEGASALRARLHGSTWQPATVVARGEDADLALLRIEGDGRDPAPLASALGVGAGDGVLGVGSPRQMSFSVSRGIVSYAGRRLRGLRYLQTDLAVNPGSSGGPVIDQRGHVVALMAFVLRDADGVSFATPVDYALDRFAEHLDGRLVDGDLEAFRAWADGGQQ